MKKKIILISIIFTIFLISGCTYLKDIIRENDININEYTYSSFTDNSGNKVDLKLKITSSKKLTKSYPAIIMIPAGGFEGESKTNYDKRLIEATTKRFIAISIQTRTFKEANNDVLKMIKDTKTAIKYLKENSNKFNIDKNKIVLLGDGSGAYLALMSGFTGNYFEYNKKMGFENSQVSVNLIADWYSQTNILKNSKKIVKSREFNNKLLNCQMNIYFENCQNENNQLSPIFYVTQKTPPTIIFQGSADINVDPTQSEDLVRKLREKIKYKTKLVRFKGVQENFLQSNKQIDIDATTKSFEELYFFIERNLN